jgi:hypothetical protein
MTKRTTPKPDAPVPAETWFIDLIRHAQIAAGARMHEQANAEVAVSVERDAWAELARCCAAAPSEGSR